MARPRLIYASSSDGVHDRRWIAALESLGFDVDARVLAEHPDAGSLGDIAGALAVVAGPLPTIARHLIPCPLPVIGVSWGYDLQQDEDITWLSGLYGLIVDTDHTRRIAIAAGVEPTRITTIPWGIDIERIDGIAMKRPQGVAPGERIVLSARAHEPIYRVDEILRAFAATDASDTRLVVAHGGTLTPALRKLSTQLGIDAVFTGSISEDELIALLKSADVYVSASEIDGSSVTLLQAMACGTRVAVSDTPGNLEWVTPGQTGWVFATGDVIGLAASIASALNDAAPGIEDRARAEVRDRADWAANVSRLLTVLPTV